MKLYKLFAILCRDLLYYILYHYIFIILYIIIVGWDNINIHQFQITKENLKRRRNGKREGDKVHSRIQTSDFSLGRPVP